MKCVLIALGVASSALAAMPAAAQSQPVRLTVPQHVLWCATSRPLEVTDATDPVFADLVFDQLYEALEEAALGAELVSVGIPFAEEPRLTAGGEEPRPDSPPVPEAGPAATSATYVITVCSVVDPAAPAPPPSPPARDDGTVPVAAQFARKEVPARDVYAIHCKVEEEEDCKTRLAELIRSEGRTLPDDMDGKWRVRQALAADGSPAALSAALSDYKLRPLGPESTEEEPPLSFAIYWLPVDEAAVAESASETPVENDNE